MVWLRNKDNGNIYSVDAESVEYAYLAGEFTRILSSVDGRPLYEEIGLEEARTQDATLPFGKFFIVKYLGAVATAADDINSSCGLAPADGTIVSAALVAAATITGQATNYRTFSLVDDGTPANAGASYAQVVPVTLGTLALNGTGVSVAAGQENALGSVSGNVSANDLLRFAAPHTGTGLATGDVCLLARFTRKA